MRATWLLAKNYSMDAAEWSKIITTFIAFAYRPCIVGLPSAMYVFHFTFYRILLIGIPAIIFSSVLSAYLSEELIKLYYYIISKIFPNKKQKKVTHLKRLLVKIKHYFGIVGIAIVSPIILSIPVGTFIAISFFGYKQKFKIMLLMSLFNFLWVIALYFIFLRF